MIAWTKNRVINFSQHFAQRYVELLVCLDGRPYEQDRFFKLLADSGLVRDVSQDGDDSEISKKRRKRWDSYLGKIREFGLGFAVEERRKGGPIRTIWRASSVAKDFTAGRLTYRQFMALQLMRLQLPKPAMPLQNTARIELQRGVLVRPLVLILDALEELQVRSAAVYLSRDEIFHYLTCVERHDQLNSAIDAILASREGVSGIGEMHPLDDAAAARAEEQDEEDETKVEGTGQASQDIWLNEFEATGYIRQLRPAAGSGLPAHIIVRALPRWEEAHRLKEIVPFQYYDTSLESIDAYFDFLSSSPSPQERDVLMMSQRVVQLEVPNEVCFDPQERELTGPIEVIGGLTEGSLVLLTGDHLDSVTRATIFEVLESVSQPTARTVSVHLRAVLVRTDNRPVVTG